ncbi:hypothetical protein IWW34DRAFT_148622 [Fusarium oxysporum f. sp. albedinis]|nr:hypothetical protein IWW34DRAFT_148622 [Fusarium oxysporum f. sp. albedinis]
MMCEGGSMAVDFIRSKLGIDAFNTLPISSNPFWEQLCSMDQRALPQSTEGGILESVYRQSECLVNDYMPNSPTSSLDHWNHPYPATTLTATPSVFQTPFPKTPHQLGIPSPSLTAKKEERQKRKRCLNKNSTRKFSRRDSSRDTKVNTTTGGGGGTGCSNRPCSTHGDPGSEHSDQQGKSNSQHAKERNRARAGTNQSRPVQLRSQPDS